MRLWLGVGHGCEEHGFVLKEGGPRPELLGEHLELDSRGDFPLDPVSNGEIS